MDEPKRDVEAIEDVNQNLKGLEAEGDAPTVEEEAHVIRKLDRRLMPMIFVIYSKQPLKLFSLLLLACFLLVAAPPVSELRCMRRAAMDLNNSQRRLEEPLTDQNS